MRCKDCGHEISMNKVCERPIQAATDMLKHMAAHNASRAFAVAASALGPEPENILAVEPVREMRTELERRVPGVATLGGTAERIPLNDGYVDAVTVGQAFHWFNPDVALREIHRVLRPGGGLALIWNARDERDPLQAALSEIIDPLEGKTPRRKQKKLTWPSRRRCRKQPGLKSSWSIQTENLPPENAIS